MKIFVISGAHSNVGKTQLARAICAMLPGSTYVKIGHGKRKPDVDGAFYHLETPFSIIAADHKNAETLVIESNSILGEIRPDCTVYLPSENPKPSAALARGKADIIRGEKAGDDKIAQLSTRLALPVSTIVEIVRCVERSKH